MKNEESEEIAVGTAEVHRAFAREIDRNFSLTYGFGGGFVLIVMVTIVIVGFFMGLIGSPATWMIALTAGLVALFVVRSRINKKRSKLRVQVEQYCEINGLNVESLRTHFAAENLYPYFGALFEQRALER